MEVENYRKLENDLHEEKAQNIFQTYVNTGAKREVSRVALKQFELVRTKSGQ